MVKYKIEMVEGECIGCGLCASLCPDNWETVEKDGQLKAKPKNTEIEELGCNRDAAEQCPVNCIHIVETETGNKLV